MDLEVLEKNTVQSEFPVTAAQRSIYFGHQLDSVGHLYNTGIYTETLGEVDIDRVVEACRSVLDQAETLHVNFDVDARGALVQIARESRDWDLPVIDFRAEADPREASLRWMRERMESPVDLATDLLFTFAVHLIDGDTMRLYQQYHHIINDGYGIALVLNKIMRAYVEGTAPDLSAEWALARFVETDVEYTSGTTIDDDRDYWIAELGDLPTSPRLITVDHLPAPGVTSVTLTLDLDRRQRLEEYGKAHGLRLSWLVIALLGGYVARATGTTDVVLSLPTTARGTRELRAVPGMVASVLPMRIDVGEQARLADIATSAEQKMWKLLKHGRYRGEAIGRELAARNPDWRPPGIGINIMPNSTSRFTIGRESNVEMLASGPVGELEFIVLLHKSGQPIEIGLRSHPDNAQRCNEIADSLGDFIDSFLEAVDESVWSYDVDGLDVAAADRPHDEDGAGPLTLLPSLAARRDNGLHVASTLREHRIAAPVNLTREQLVDTVAAIVTHHHGLRATLTAPVPVLWMLAIAEPDAVKADSLIGDDVVPDPATGRGLCVSCSADGELILTAAAGLIDDVSWQVVTEDFATALRAVSRGRNVVLPPVPTSLKAHARRFAEEATSPSRLAELVTWTSVLAPGANLVMATDTADAAAARTELLTPAEYDTATTRVPSLVKGEPADVWAAATALAVSRWTKRVAGAGELTVDVWRDGRQPWAAGDDVDLSRTVGPLGYTSPIRLVLTDDAHSALRSAKERARAAGGSGWPLLRYANVQAGPALAALPTPQVLVRTGGDRIGRYALDIAVHADKSGGATVEFASDFGIDDAELATLAGLWRDALCELVALAEGGATSGLTPSDLRHIALTQSEIELVESVSDVVIEDIWPLSPLQRGLFFQSVFDSGQDIYTAQFSLDFGHRIDVARMRGAAASLLDENPTVRAGFTNDGLGDPVQFIGTGLEVPFVEADLSMLSPAEQKTGAEELAAADRARPFDLTAPPLWRMLLIHLGDGIDRLVINREFILWDGWSGALFVDQLLARYAGDAVPAAGAQFTDYLTWLDSRDPGVAAQAWRRNFEGFENPTLIAAGAKGGAPVVPTRIESYVDAELTAALREQARRSGVTLNALMNAVMGLLLSAESGRTDVVFGSTVAGRPTEIAGLESVLGMFLNTVPVRVTLVPGETVSQLLRRMQDEYVERMECEYLGLGEIQRATGHTELFDTLFVLQNFKNATEMAAQSARHDIVAEDSLDHTHYPLAVVVSPGEQLHVKIDYRHDIVDATRAHALHDRFITLLETVAHDGDRLVAAVPALTPTELGRAALSWDAPLPAVEDVTIAEMLIERAATIPDEVALVFGDERVTYQELAGRVEALARQLIIRGGGPESVVALGLPRTVDMVVALFAVLRAGAAYLPLELDQPDDRLATVIEDAEPVLFVTNAAAAARLSLPADRSILLGGSNDWDTSPLTAAELGAFAPGRVGRLDHPAYVIYTSGSTGKPKGVLTPYRGLTNMQRNHQDKIFEPVVAAEGGRRLRVAHTVSFAFDMSWEELLWLVEGHEVHICDEDLRRDANALVDYCDRQQIDVVNVTPTYATALLAEGLLDREPIDGNRTGHRPPLVLLGGEAVPDSVWNRLRESEGTLGYNLYGPTEYTINTLGAGTDDSVTPTVGTPIRATRGYILDAWLRPVVDGVAGELYIAGVGLARGYLGRTDLTADRFVADPFGGDRMYRTGDFVRLRRDGNLDYLGRIDDQVKIRGYRVELHEIESAVESHPLAASAAVVAVEDPLVPGMKRLAGYMVTTDDSDPDIAATVLAYLRAKLPDYMVPSTLQIIDAIPMTVNGKLDAKALPMPEIRTGASSRPPKNATEQALCDVFADLLELDSVGAEDDFFELGGHSMIAMRVVSRVRAEFDVQLTIRDLFEARTPALIAELLPSAASAQPSIGVGNRPEFVPLSAAQERLWMLAQLQDDSLSYHYAHVARLDGALDEAALAAALQDVVGRHESLRTVIGIVDGNPFQQIVDVSEATRLEIVGADAETAQGLVIERLTANFDLRTDVPLRVTLVRITPTEYIIVLVLHHIATDEWSDAPLLGDLTRAYLSRTQGQAPAWEPLPVQYADYSLWQHDLLSGDLSDRQLGFWRESLAGLPDEIVLPTNRLRPAQPTGTAGNVQIALGSEVVQKLRGIADDHRGTMFMVLHAATAAVLSRLGGGNDIAVGSPVSGRSDSALDNLVGFFVNTVVLRTDLSGDPTFGELVDRTRDADLSAMDHQDIPFQRVVEELAPPRVEGRNPLFQVMVSYLQRAGVLPDFLGVPTRWEQLTNVRAKFDLNVTFVDAPDTGEVTVIAEYAEDLFDRERVAMILAVLSRFVDQVAAAPSSRVGAVELVDAGERAHRLAVGVGPRAAVESVTIGDLLSRQAALSPTATALSAFGEQIDYAQLEARSNRLARLLIEDGAGPGDVVAVAVPRSADLIVAIHAVVKSGAAYLPIDTGLPASRIEYMLGDARPVRVFATSAVTLPGGVARTDVDAPAVQARLQALSGDAVTERHSTLTAAHPVYLIYTSGSTGNPKGVLVSHQSVVNRLAWVQAESPVLPTDRVVLKTPTTFDVSVWELFWPSVNGATTVIAGPDTHRDPVALVQLLRANDVTIAHFVPAMLEEALTEQISAVTSLRRVVCSGEALQNRTVARFAAALPGVRLDNLYGPTEAAVEVTLAADLARDLEVDPAGSSSIGGPGSNVELYVLDSSLQPTPAGVAGELYIGGVQVAYGYLGRSALTADRFVADPNGDAGSRLYRTGDLVRWTENGTIEFLGRLDDQVKIRGLRIELGEVETILEGQSDVTRAVAAVHRNPEGEAVLVGYVMTAVGVVVDATTLRNALSGTVPDYLIPAIVIPVDEFPVSFNGKLDRKALPRPSFESAVSSREPRTDFERQVCEVFASALGLETVGIDDDFFSLGGHSLTAIRLVNALRSELGVELAVRSVFEAPTVAQLAVLAADAGSSTSSTLGRRERPERVPVSFAQRRMWILDQLGVDGGAYNVPISWRVPASVDVAALAAAVQDVVLRHEALRTVFHSAHGEPYQVVVPENAVDVPVHRHMVSADDVTEEVAHASRYSFDLEHEIPVRVSVFEFDNAGETHTVVLLLIHHIATDEWSTRALLGDLMSAYALRQLGQSPGWAPLPVQYADYTLWQQEILGDREDPESLATAQETYWRKNLAGLPEELSLPFDRTRPARTSYVGGAVYLAWEPEVVVGLRALAREHNVSMFMLAQAAVAVLLHKSGAGADIPLGTPVSGRGDAQLEDLVGFFLNTVVLRTDLSGNPTLAELLNRIRDSDLGAFEHQDLPFEQVVDSVLGGGERSRSMHPLFQTMIVYLTEPNPAESLGAAMTPEPIEVTTAKFDLSFDFVEYAGTDTVVGMIEYSSELFDRSTVQRLADGLAQVLKEFTALSAERRLSEIVAVPAADQELIEAAWGVNPIVVPTLTAADLFDTAVARYTDETALLAADVSWTFGELGARVNRLARVLIGHGVGPETVVALMLPRSAESVVAILAVLTAGGAYVACDPDAPAGRLDTIFETVSPAVTLTVGAFVDRIPASLVLAMDSLEFDELSSTPVTNADRLAPLHADHPAYIVFTSGSTGVPKAVVAPHRGLVTLFHSHRADLYVPTQERAQRDRLRVGHAWSFAFDASWQPQLWLLDGHALCVVDETTQRDPRRMALQAREQEWDFVEVTPSHLAQLIDNGLLDGTRVPASLGFGGEAVSQPLWNLLREKDGVEAYNLYGPSESTVDALVARVSDSTSPVAGRPVGNTRAHILDQWLRPVPVGVEGELYLSGDGVVRGYLGARARTAERFVADPFSADGTRMYRTGDRAKWTASGHIQYRGRTDDQVKVRGYRIEPAEIEAALLATEGIGAALVLVRDDIGARALVAYVVADGIEPDNAGLRRSLSAVLPDYMIPSAFVVLDEIPTLPNGKIDRAALPRPEIAPTGEYREPVTEIEKILCRVVADHVGLDQVGLGDDIFALGCDSIGVMAVMSRLREAGCEVEAAQVFAAGSLGELAEELTPVRLSGS